MASHSRTHVTPRRVSPLRWASTAVPSSRAPTSSGVSRGRWPTPTGARRRPRGADSSPRTRCTQGDDGRIPRRRDARGGRTARCPASPCASPSCAAGWAGCTTARRSSSTRWRRREPSSPSVRPTPTPTGSTHRSRGAARRTCVRCGTSSRCTSNAWRAMRWIRRHRTRRRSSSARCGARDAGTREVANLSPSGRAATSSATARDATRRRSPTRAA